LEKFKDFCLVDLNLDKRTAECHFYAVRKLLNWIKIHGYEGVNADVIREYLMMYLDKSKCTRANQIKAFRRFFRDYLGVSEVIASFKLPRANQGEIGRYIELPFTKCDLQRLYRELENTKNRIRNQAMFLLTATTGLRRNEILLLTLKHIDRNLRCIIPNVEKGTKRTGITFYNDEAEKALNELLKQQNLAPNQRLFNIDGAGMKWVLVRASKRIGLKTPITPQMLRVWFSYEMGQFGVPDRYIDIFQGRSPRSILSQFYTPRGIEELKQIYGKANLKVLS